MKELDISILGPDEQEIKKLYNNYRKTNLSTIYDINKIEDEMEKETGPGSIFELSGLKLISDFVESSFKNELLAYYIDSSPIAEKTKLKNVLWNFVFFKNCSKDNLKDNLLDQARVKETYKRVYYTFHKNHRTIYYHKDFFREPENIKCLISYYPLLEDNQGTKIDKESRDQLNALEDDLDYFENNPKMIEIKDFQFYPLSNSYIASISIPASELSNPSKAEKEKERLRENQEFFHKKIVEGFQLEKKESVLISLPIIGASREKKENRDRRFYGVGGAFILLFFKDDLNIKENTIEYEKKFRTLAKNLSYSLKDVCLPFLYDSAKFLVRETLNNALKSAIVAIMSRNGSHNIGSHVIYNIIKDINILNVQNNRLFLKYIQHRMDFIAQISTTWISEWSSSSWLVKEIFQGLSEQEHLLNYIGRAENLKICGKNYGDNILKSIVINIIQYEPGDETSVKDSKRTLVGKFGSQSEFKRDKDVLIAVPGGSIGFHAVYTIIENFIRNAAKHNFSSLPDEFKKNLEINLEFEDRKKSKTVAIRIFDNISYISNIYNYLTKIDEDCRRQYFDELKRQGNENFSEKFFDELYKLIKQGNQDYLEKFNNFKEHVDKANLKINNIEKIRNNNSSLVLASDKIKIIKVQVKKSESEISILDRTPEEIHNKFEDEKFLNDLNNNIILFIIHPYVSNNNLPTPKLLDLFYLIMHPSVRFIQQPIWENLRETNSENLEQLLGQLLSSQLEPLHEDINKKLSKNLISDDGNLKKENWGLGEMKICAGYLKKEKIEVLGKGGEAIAQLIKAKPMPEYDSIESNKIKAYRLGYEFELSKPREILILTTSEKIDDKESLEKLRNESIFISNNENIYDMGKIDYADYESIVITRDLFDKLERRNLLNDFIERLPYRIIILGNSDVNIPEQYRERLAKASIQDLTKDDVSISSYLERISEKDDELRAFKLHIYNFWIRHLKKEIRNINETIYLILKIQGTESKSSSTGVNQEKKLLERFSSKLCGSLDVDDEDTQCIWEVAKNFFGYFSKKYTPCSSLIGDVAENEAKSLVELQAYKFDDDLDTNDLKIKSLEYDFKHEQYNHNKTISYLRHSSLCNESKCESHHTPIHDEILSAASSYFSFIANIQSKDNSYEKNKILLKLIENGLIKVAIADERVWSYLSEKEELAIKLSQCGIFPVRQLHTFKQIEGDKKVMGNDVNIVSIEIEKREIKIYPPKTTKPNCIIIHQGILDKISWDNTIYKNDFDFLKILKKKIPFVIVTSGRGEPAGLPKTIKFMGFSIIEQYILADPHSKFILTDIIMRLSRKGEQ